MGKAFPGVECKIVDINTGETLPPNEIGEFCARGYNIMKGYYKMPEATALAIDTGRLGALRGQLPCATGKGITR